MTVTTSLVAVERAWTGVETIVATGIPAGDAAHVVVMFRDGAGLVTGPLARGSAYNSVLNSGVLNILPLALPAAPGTLLIRRETPGLQPADFQNNYGAEVHNALHDAHVLRHNELKERADRAVVSLPGDPVRSLPAYDAADDGRMLAQVGGALAFRSAEDLGLAVLAQLEQAAADALEAIGGEVETAEGHALAAGTSAASAIGAAAAANADRTLIESLLGFALDAGDQDDPPGATLDHGEQT